ncbi:hypothetical protein Ahy_B01g053783 [Arachis hypogaea]|uniref:Uncharacterized protein n=1 Tax=Arachis hypogaea TaxID=3818 RepID=A0A445ASK0_ARAHY|nr:hypothetical protein Ahy_B01g053783 [Arachis hypogaea]
MTVAPPSSPSSNPHTQPSLCRTLIVSQRSLAPSTLLHLRTQESALLCLRTLVGFRTSIGEEKRKRKTLEEKPSADSAIEASEKKRKYHESIEEEEQDSHPLCEVRPPQLSPPKESLLRLRTRRLRRLGKEPTASFSRLATALPIRPSLSRRFTLSMRMKAFLALQFARFLSSRKCSIGILLDNWSVKAIRRKTTGTGRMRYLRHVPCQFKSGFREGTEAAPRKKGAAASGETVHGNHHHLGQALLEETRVALQSLKSRGIRFPSHDNGSLAPIFTPLRLVSEAELDLPHQTQHDDIPVQSFTPEQTKEAFDVARNSIELLSTMLPSSPQQDVLQISYLKTVVATEPAAPAEHNLCKIDSEGKARKVTGCSCIVVKVRRMGSKETASIVMHEEYKILKCYKNDRSSSKRAISFL